MAEPTYTRVNWQNFPSKATPINATNLNNIENGIEINRDAIQALNNKFKIYDEEATCTWNLEYGSVWGNQRMFCTQINNLLFCTLSFEANPGWIAAITAANDVLLLCNFWRNAPTSCTIPITGINKTNHTSRTDYLTLTKGSPAITIGRGNTDELQNTTYYFVNFILDLSKF